MSETNDTAPPTDDLIDDMPTTSDAADPPNRAEVDREENDQLADTAAERITQAQIDAARQAARHLGDEDREQVQRVAHTAEVAFTRASQAEERSAEAQARKYGELYEAILLLLQRLALIFALCAERNVRLTQASWKSPCLAPVKALLPQVDQKDQSFMAKVLNYGLAHGVDRDSMESLVREKGVVAIAKLETRRQKDRRGQAGRLDEEEAIAQFKRERRGTPVSGVVPPEDGLFLMIGEMIGERVVVYDVDDNETRKMAVIRSAVKRGSQLLDTSSRERGQTAESALDEGEDR